MHRHLPLIASALLFTFSGCGKPDRPPPKSTTKGLKAQGGAAQSKGNGPKGTGAKAGEEGEILAKVGDNIITRKQFESRLNQQSPFARNRLNSPDRKQEFLENLIRFELLALDASKKGFDDHPDVVLARKQAMVRAFMAEELRDMVKIGDITDEEVLKYYEEHKDEYDRPPQVRAGHLLIANGEGAEAKARDLLAKINAEVEQDKFKARDIFSRYARRYSEDEATRSSGGDLKFFGKPGESQAKRGPADPVVPPPVALSAYGLVAVGDIASEPVKSSAGWHLVQKTGFRRAYTRTLKDVKTSIRNKLFRVRKTKAMDDYVASLKKEAKIEVNDAVLESVKVKRIAPRGPGITPPGMAPPGFDAVNPPQAPGLAPVPGAQPLDPRMRQPVKKLELPRDGKGAAPKPQEP
ncbi:MAG: peptidyl-prolyl cis-trans isomerase [Bradymonadia bacterium]